MPAEGAIHIGGQSMVCVVGEWDWEWSPGANPRRVTES